MKLIHTTMRINTMKYTNLTYQSKVLNRLANMAYNKGGLSAMRNSIDKAMDHIWNSLESYYNMKGGMV